MQDLSLAVDFLHATPPFNALGADDLRALAGKLEAAYYAQEKTIFASSSEPGLAIIRKGAVRLMDEEHRFLDKRSEGEIFGHAIWFHGEQKLYVAEAEEDCLIWHLPPQDLEKFREKEPRFAEYFSSHLKTRLSAAVEVGQAVTQLRDLLKKKPVTVDSTASIRDAAILMSGEGVSSVLVLEGGRLAGIATDKDLRRRVLVAGLDTGNPISEVMTAAPKSLPASAGVDAALLLMMRENYHHLPIIEDGKPIGLVTAGDILRVQSEHPLRLVRDIHKKKSLDELVILSRRLPSLFVRMVQLGRDVEQIGRMITHITDAFTVRLLQCAERELGEPPMAYAWVAFGSQAREEQTARTDQDNGIVLEREADEREADYFAKLSNLVCEGLDRLGYVYCPGEIMAMNVKWRLPLDKWKRQFDEWIEGPDPKSVMHCSIFFDLRCIHGKDGLVEELQIYACARARENHIFRRFMAANALKHRPPLGFFRRFVQESDGTHSEGLNLKHRGIVPITDLVRLRALEGGITAANTFNRIELAAAQGLMNESDARSLKDALRLISRIRLEHQSGQMSQGQQPTNLVPPDELSPLMRRNLKAAFTLVMEAQEALALRYQAH